MSNLTNSIKELYEDISAEETNLAADNLIGFFNILEQVDERLAQTKAPHLEMSAEKLLFKPRKPFDVFLNLPHRPNWLPLVSIFRTQRRDEVANFGQCYSLSTMLSNSPKLFIN